MDKNFVLALAASLLVFFAYNTYQIEKYKKQQIAEIERQEEVAPKTTTQGNKEQKPLVSLKSQKHGVEKLHTIDTKHAKIVLTNKGAAIKEFVYKDFNTDLNLTPFGNEGYFATLSDVYFEPAVPENGDDIAFQTQVADGVTLVKSYKINKEQGLSTLNITFKNETKEDLTLSDFYINMGPGLNTVKSELSENSANLRAYCSIKENGKKHITVNKLKSNIVESPVKLKNYCNDWIWAGIDNRYFLTALIPTNWKGSPTGFTLSKQFLYETPSFFGLFGNSKTDGPQLKILVPAELKSYKTTTFSSDFYIGPKDLQVLEKLPYDLQRSIQFGFFGQLGKWMRNLLEWLNKYTHNYGFAIILMTFMIQLVMFPLTYKQLKASAIMQKMQPEINAIQERYKNKPSDPQQAQQQQMKAQMEMMALYKKYGTNPLSGCLPIFVQMPIFFALFNALRTSWALHGSPFILWITDLSAKDPYYVLPISMGILMFVQQRLTMPSTAKDNPYMSSMKWMPIFMTVLFMNFPAGLTLYWFISNCISFVVNLILKRKLAHLNQEA